MYNIFPSQWCTYKADTGHIGTTTTILYENGNIWLQWTHFVNNLFKILFVVVIR
jgi:hypothetical protein